MELLSTGVSSCAQRILTTWQTFCVSRQLLDVLLSMPRSYELRTCISGRMLLRRRSPAPFDICCLLPFQDVATRGSPFPGLVGGQVDTRIGEGWDLLSKWQQFSLCSNLNSDLFC